VDHLDYLFAGFAVFWAALFAYLLWLQARLRSVTRQLERLEERLADAEGPPEPAAHLAPSPEAPPRERPGERTVTTG
jgi:CcmD family protein